MTRRRGWEVRGAGVDRWMSLASSSINASDGSSGIRSPQNCISEGQGTTHAAVIILVLFVVRYILALFVDCTTVGQSRPDANSPKSK